ncbi:T9SS type A sorting domain-containing protein [Cryomorpha ignava]|uniref:T9SS type A sorting domain-containing protein n=1 Tax=Cryomorpha ignava TaxID=101383 RepID=A0A7K3WT80_9FLAO|nr:T9SS type A sorting domain-containing protein [Cryomorpha ignava]NEN24748.1 T9SS type A sorting domain-containing protein [Cryomorpha ignava]
MVSQSEAVFTDLVRTSFDGSTVTKTNGNSNWNAGAFSTAGVLDNGSAETTISQTGKTRIFGLSHSNNPNQNGINTVEYAIVLNAWGYAEIRESGNYKAFLWFFGIGDKFKIEVINGVVQYYKNDNLVYISNTSPSLPLYVDLAFEDIGGEIADVQITNTTSTTIRAFSDQNSTGISTFQWYQNNVQLPETGSEITLTSFTDGDILNCSATPLSGSSAGMELQSNSMVLTHDEITPEVNFQISAIPAEQGCFLAQEEVIWQANIPENIEINGGSVAKTNGYNTSNGGVYSQNFVTNNGYFELQTGELNSRKMVGLSSSDGGSPESSIQFAFYIEWGGSLRVYENGNWRAGVGNMNTTDKLRIHVDNGVVKYYKNDALLYVSDQTPTLPLIADGTIQDIGATITNAVIANPTQGEFTVMSESEITGLNWKVNGQTTGQAGFTISLDELNENDIVTCSYLFSQIGCGNFLVESNPIKILKNDNIAPHLFYIEGIQQVSGIGVAEEEIVWNPASLANVSNIDNDLTKVQGNNQYNAGASSLNTVKNNGYFDFTVSEKNRTKAIGLSTNDPNYNYNTTDYAMVLASNGKFTIYESGSWRLGNVTYNVGDNLRIAVENNIVKYYQNQTLVYTSNVAPSLPLIVDISLRSEGGTVQNAVVGNENEGKFTAHLMGLGESPTLEWNVNDNATGSFGSIFNHDNIENEDIITCTVIPDFAGCTTDTKFESNYIRFIGPPTRTDWLGTVSTSWSNPANWSEGVPNVNLSAKVPAGRPHQPLINSAQSVKNITVEAGADLKMAGIFSLLVYGDFSIEGEFDPGNGIITFSGSTDQRIQGNDLKFNKLIVNSSNSANSLLLLSPIYIASETVFINGKIKTLNEEVIYLPGSDTRIGNTNSFIDGKVRKIGNSEFLFPIGSGNIYAPVEISSPDNLTDAFTAEYFNNDPSEAGYATSSQDGTLASASSCEYWMIDRTAGQSAVRVSLSYENERSCGVNDPSYLQVAHWNGSEWENKGLQSYDGDINSGTITSEELIDDFSPFTLGSRSGINPLPIQLSSFTAQKRGDETELLWKTESETNNAYFTLERSNNAIDFNPIKTISGAGTSHQSIDYVHIDHSPQSGINYYRLSQTDYDGKQTFFDIQSVYFEPNSGLSIYPNPSTGTFSIERKSDHKVQLRLIDMFGKIRWQEFTDQILIRVAIPDLSKGVYLLEIDDGIRSFTEKVIIQ